MTMNEFEALSKTILNCVQIIFYLAVGIWTVFSGIKFLNEKMDESRYRTSKFKKEILDEWNDLFLSEVAMERRHELSKFWINNYWEIEKCDNAKSVEFIDVYKLCIASKKYDSYEVLDGIKIKFINNISDIPEDIKSKTSCVLNQFEHIGKLLDSEVLSRREINTFFYTLISDTFISCLPFIVYRRTIDNKPAYASKFEALSIKYPRLSESWCTT